jgi:hypothetical protein
MATVPDLARPSTPLDRPLSSPNRTIAASPLGGETPQYRGELVVSSANGTMYVALGTANTSWAIVSLVT